MGDEGLMERYRAAFETLQSACRFGKTEKMLACLKYALKLEGVIESDMVATRTPALTDAERKIFAERYREVKRLLAETGSELWASKRNDV